MSLTTKQKKYILKKVKIQQNIDQIASDLNLTKEVVDKYLQKRSPKEKYQKIVKKDKSPTSSFFKKKIIKTSFNFKVWLKNNYLVLILLTVLVLVSYLNSLNNEFLSDDIGMILNHPDLDNLNYLKIHMPIPLHYFFKFIINQIFGRVPWAFRSLNIFFHLGTVLALYLLVNLITNSRVALISSILLAIHPVQHEAIVWISAGHYVQYTFFILLSLITYILSGKNKKFYFLSIVFLILALISSEKATVFPAILFVLILAMGKLKTEWKKIIIPFILSAFLAIVFLAKVPQRLSTLKNQHYQQIQTINPLLQVPLAISSYLELISWPKNLTLYHSEMHLSWIEYTLRLGILISLLGAIIYSFFKNKQVFFWLSFFVIALLPTLTPLGVSWIVAERYAYMANIGIFVCMALFINKLLKNKKYQAFIIVFLILISIILMARTIVRNTDWKNQDNLWLAAAKTSPSSPQNHNNLGDYYARQKNLPKAAEEFETAIKLNPRYADAMHNLANVYFQMKKIDEAKEGYQKAIQMNPNLWQSYQNLAFISFQQEDIDEARSYLEKALSINPGNATLYQNLSIIYQKQGDEKTAQELMQKAITLNPQLKQGQ